MKSLIKKIYYKIVNPYAFEDTVNKVDRLKWSIRFQLAARGIYLTQNERRLAKLRDKHKGQRCFIIGNGPSLNLLDLSKLKNEVTFGVNAIYLNYEKMGFYPTYYVVEDTLVAEDRGAEINEYKGSLYKFYGAYLSYVLKPDDKTIFMHVVKNYADKANFPLFSKDCNKFLGVGGSVTFLCLQLAYYMGFKEVIMIGFDHNYVVPQSAIITNKGETGFDILSTEDDQNHFTPSYFGKGYRWHDPQVERMEVGFKKARDTFEAEGRAVYNATAGGKLEVFKRKNYNDLFL